MVGNTPVLDIKPYRSALNGFEEGKNRWMSGRIEELWDCGVRKLFRQSLKREETVCCVTKLTNKKKDELRGTALKSWISERRMLQENFFHSESLNTQPQRIAL